MSVAITAARAAAGDGKVLIEQAKGVHHRKSSCMPWYSYASDDSKGRGVSNSLADQAVYISRSRGGSDNNATSAAAAGDGVVLIGWAAKVHAMKVRPYVLALVRVRRSRVLR